MIEFSRIKTRMGIWGLCSNNNRITKVLFPNNNQNHIIPQTPINKRSFFFTSALKQLNQYFSKERKSFKLDLNLDLPEFYKMILSEVSKIKYGKTISYKELAIKVGNPKLARAVGCTNATNPIPLLIPCHRVVMHNGEIGGSAGGQNLKKCYYTMKEL